MQVPQPRQGIANIRAHMQGLPDPGEGRIIKLASNESAFGPSPHAIAAARDAVEHMERYAEQGTGELQRAIGACFELDPARIACGPGSDELLLRIMRAYLEPGQELVHSAHGYAKFANYAWACDATPVAAPDRDFRADPQAILDCVNERTRVVAIANPDNPTGTCLPGRELRHLREALPERVVLILDCAYAEYVDAEDYGEPARLVDEFPNVVMTRTFSKIFGLAGERLGWLYAAAGVIEVMRRLSATFPISVTALAAGIAAAGDRAYTARVKARSNDLRAHFSDALTQAGLRVYPSQSNFVLVDFSDHEGDAESAYAHLLAQGIITRRFPQPAFAQCLRVSVGLEEEMALCLQHLQDYLNAR